jgi:hypothetical protein
MQNLGSGFAGVINIVGTGDDGTFLGNVKLSSASVLPLPTGDPSGVVYCDASGNMVTDSDFTFDDVANTLTPGNNIEFPGVSAGAITKEGPASDSATAGKTLSYIGAPGSASVTVAAGGGGLITFVGGVGGVASAGFAGGTGGIAQLKGGAGGAGSAAQVGGAGGGISILGGNGGATGGAGAGDAGSVTIDTGTGNNGAISIGGTNATTLTIGHAGASSVGIDSALTTIGQDLEVQGSSEFIGAVDFDDSIELPTAIADPGAGTTGFQLYATSVTGATNSIGIRVATNVAADIKADSTHTLLIEINGAEYKIMLNNT